MSSYILDVLCAVEVVHVDNSNSTCEVFYSVYENKCAIDAPTEIRRHSAIGSRVIYMSEMVICITSGKVDRDDEVYIGSDAECAGHS